MKNKYRVLLSVLALVLFAAGTGYGQGISRKQQRAVYKAKSREMKNFTVKSRFGKSKQYASVGAMLGATNYFGDLAPRTTRWSTSLSYTRIYLGGYYTKRLNANISLRGSLAWARLRGDDSKANRNTPEGNGRYLRNLSFRNDVIEAAVTGIVDILPTDRGYLRRNFLNGYGMLGLVAFYHNPKGKVPTGMGLDKEGKWIALQPLGTEGEGMGTVTHTDPATGLTESKTYRNRYFRIQPAIMVGGGVKYRIDDKIDIGLEFGWRFTFTDFLDDVGGTYVPDQDAATAGKTPLWYAMSNRSGQLTTSTGEDRSFGSTDPRRVPWTDAGPNQYRLNGYGTSYDVQNVPGVGATPFFNSGSPRSNKAKDGYTVTTLTATYILEFRARTPKFR